MPGIEEIASDFNGNFFRPLLICDNNTESFAAAIQGSAKLPVCILEAGESRKGWPAVETILRCACDAGTGRDGTFIGIGGGVVGDLSAFAASIYMRGCSLALIPTTLLGMVDAGLGGKTGIDLFGIKNLAGTFYPARHVYMPIESLSSLPPREWKSGMAELIKTAVLEGDDFLDMLSGMDRAYPLDSNLLCRCISRAARFKGGIVSEDPFETGNRRMLLNLGHTFGHALEAAAGLEKISHGEAVAWGIARSCELGLALGICPAARAERITSLLDSFAFETTAAHPLLDNIDYFMRALCSDKKKRGGKINFIVPDEKSARPAAVDLTEPHSMKIIDRIIKGELSS